jgi:hypothetical protein
MQFDPVGLPLECYWGRLDEPGRFSHCSMRPSALCHSQGADSRQHALAPIRLPRLVKCIFEPDLFTVVASR